MISRLTSQAEVWKVFMHLVFGETELNSVKLWCYWMN